MSSIVLQPGNIPVIVARLVIPWRGVWLAELELSPELLSLVPTSGKVQIILGPATAPPLATLVGTIDPRGSGTFVEQARVRVLGGAGGWDQIVGRQWYHSDGGLLPAQVFGPTAAEVGEVVSATTPFTLGVDFVRTAGPASRVLDGFDWWVDPTAGTTFVGVRPPVVADPTLEIMTWDPAQELAELHCETLVLPGTTLVDARIPASPLTVRDVEMVFDENGAHARAWCGSNPVTQLVNDLRSAVVEFSGRRYLSTYLYRIVSQNSADGRLTVQAIDSDDGAPDGGPVTPWTGMAGASAKYAPGTTVRVAFAHADPSQVLVDAYAPGLLPLEATYDAQVRLHLGPSTPLVDVAGGGHPIAFADLLLAELVKIATAIGSLGGVYVPPTAPVAIGSAKVSSG